MKKKDILQPSWQAPQVKTPTQAMKDLTDVLQFGVSLSAIERRAKASDLASKRRRRGKKKNRKLFRRRNE